MCCSAMWWNAIWLVLLLMSACLVSGSKNNNHCQAMVGKFSLASGHSLVFFSFLLFLQLFWVDFHFQHDTGNHVHFLNGCLVSWFFFKPPFLHCSRYCHEQHTLTPLFSQSNEHGTNSSCLCLFKYLLTLGGDDTDL